MTVPTNPDPSSEPASETPRYASSLGLTVLLSVLSVVVVLAALGMSLLSASTNNSSTTSTSTPNSLPPRDGRSLLGLDRLPIEVPDPYDSSTFAPNTSEVLFPSTPAPASSSKWLEQVPDRRLVRPGEGFELPEGSVEVGNGWFSVPVLPGNSPGDGSFGGGDIPGFDDSNSEPVRWVTAFDGPPTAAWGLEHPADHDVDAVQAWSRSKGSGVVVAVIDTGVDISHPGLSSSIWVNPGEICGNGIDDDGNGFVDDCHGWNFAAGTPQVFTSDAADRHGTHIAGIIASRHTSDTAGLAPAAKVMVVKFMEGSRGRTDHAASAINYAVAQGADVINLSWGSAERSQAVDAAIANAVSEGVVVVVAAGNHGRDLASSPMFPAASAPEEALVVAAHTPQGQLASFSGFGSKVDLSAPGTGIISTVPGGRTAQMSGTSMAAPFVSAAAALYLDLYPSSPPQRVHSALTSSVAPRASMTSKLASGGILKAAAASKLASPPPQISISATETVVPAGGSAFISATAVSSDGSSLPVTFTLPNGSTRPGPNLVLPAPATRTTLKVQASATDSKGQTSSATVEVLVSDTPGDFISDPLPYASGPYDTRTATADSHDAKACARLGASLFFDVSAFAGHTHTFSTQGSDFDTVLALYSASGEVLACTDDVSSGLIRHSVLTVHIPPGAVLAAGGYAGDSGMLRLSQTAGTTPDPDSPLRGPSAVSEGDTAIFTAPAGVISVPALGVDGPSPLSVTFPADGIFAVSFTPEGDSEPSSHLTVSVQNRPPQLTLTRDGSTLSVTVTDPGNDEVVVSAYSLSGTQLTSRRLRTPGGFSWDVSGISGWLIVSAVDADAGVARAPILLGSSLLPSAPGVLPQPGFSPVLALRETRGDLDGDGSVEEVSISPHSDGAAFHVDGELAYMDSSGTISPLVVRALCVARGSGLFIAQAGALSTTEVFFLRVSAGSFAPPQRAATVAVSPLSVLGCTAGGGLVLDTSDGALRVLD